MVIDISAAPYYDDYDKTKNFTRLLVKPGFALQSREMNQIQTMYYDFLKRLEDAMMSEGAIMEGCALIVGEGQITLTPGKIYLDGIIRDVAESTLTITGVGKEYVGVILTSEIVTAGDDISLRDPAQGYPNYGLNGSDRIKQTLEVKIDDPMMAVLYELEDGILIKSNTIPEFDKVIDLMARRTFDESGNYRVDGLRIVATGDSDPEYVYIILTEGKAYIKGYEVAKPSAVRVPLKLSKTYRTVNNEPKVYHTETDTYQINNEPAKVVEELMAVVEVSDNVTRGGVPGGIDYLNPTPVVQVISVVQGGTTYVQGVDYQLSDDGIDWSLDGIEPAGGTTYVVIWQYNKIMIEGETEDFTLISDSEENYFIHFTGNGDLPVDATTFYIDYSFYLARKDIVSIDIDGHVVISEGQPEITRLVSSVINSSEDQFKLGSVLIYPNSSEVKCTNFAITRLSMEQLYKLEKRVSNTEYNMAITDLDREAMDGYPSTDMIGLYTDGFIGFTKIDVNHADWSAAIDIDNEELTVPLAATVHSLVIDEGDPSYNAHLFTKIATAPFTEYVLFNQPLATTIMNINPYAVYRRHCEVELNPSEDNWVNETKIQVVEGENTVTTSLRRWWYHQGAAWADAEKAAFDALGIGDQADWNNKQGTKFTEIAKRIVLDEAVMYMRQILVTAYGYGYTPNSNSLVGTFDNIVVPLSPVAPTTAGTQPGTVKANSLGEVICTFMVPENVMCGTKTFTLNNEYDDGQASYTAQGRNRTVESIVNLTHVIVETKDPLAQTFQFNTDKVLTSIGVYFQAKDTSNKAISFMIRGVDNGYPSTLCYAEKTLRPDQINISADSTLETKVTFDNPVKLDANTQYCLCMVTESNEYFAWLAELGGTEVQTGEIVAKQPYISGVLFSSSNNLTWTAHQKSDLKIKVYAAEFETAGCLVFDSIDPVNYSDLMLASDFKVFAGTSISWFYRINGSATWLPIQTFDKKEMSQLATSVDIKVTFTATSDLSPFISLYASNLIGFLNALEGVYVNRNVITDGYNYPIVIVDLALPAGTAATVYYASDTDGDIWNLLPQEGDAEAVDESFFRYTFRFEEPLEAPVTPFRCKVVLTTNSELSRPRAKKLLNFMLDI